MTKTRICFQDSQLISGAILPFFPWLNNWLLKCGFCFSGFSVTSGRFRGFSERVYVGGAPRSNSTGQVVVFRKDKSNLVYFKQSILSGTMAFSAFGTDLVAVDFDSDG